MLAPNASAGIAVDPSGVMMMVVLLASLAVQEADLGLSMSDVLRELDVVRLRVVPSGMGLVPAWKMTVYFTVPPCLTRSPVLTADTGAGAKVLSL